MFSDDSDGVISVLESEGGLEACYAGTAAGERLDGGVGGSLGLDGGRDGDTLLLLHVFVVSLAEACWLE